MASGVYTEITELLAAKKYLFTTSGPSITQCFSQFAFNITCDENLMNFNTCLTDQSSSFTSSDFRYLSDILLFTEIGSTKLVKLDGNTIKTVAQIIGINTTLITSDTTSLVAAINTLQTNKFDTAGAGLTSLETTVSARITTTTNKGGLEIDATDQGLGLKLATTSGLSTIGGELAVGAGTGITVNANNVQAKIDGTTVTLSGSNALQTPILVRKSDNSADTTIDIIVGGATPTGSGNGLVKLSSYLSIKTSIVKATNSVFTQKLPLLMASCSEDQGRVITFLQRQLINTVIDSSLSVNFKCFQLVTRVANGIFSTSSNTISATSKTDCETKFTTAITSPSQIGGPFGSALDNAEISGALKTEVCAQFDI